MQNLITVLEKSKTILRSYLDNELDNLEINQTPDDTYPFEYFMKISNRMKSHKFYEDIKIGDVVIGTITRVYPSKIEICLVCTMGTLIRDIYNLKIPATCSSNELPMSSNFSSTHCFRRGDFIKSIVINVTRNENIELSMNQSNKDNKLRQTDLGLYAQDNLPIHYKKLRDFNPPPDYFYEIFPVQTLSTSMEIKDKLKHFNIKTTNFSLLDLVHKIEIKPDETAKKLRNSLLMQQSNKFVVKGVEYYKLSRFNEALQCYNHALSINECNVDALVARGALRASLKSYELSIADLEQAVKIEPNHKNAADYLSKTIIAYSKSLTKDEIEKAEMLVKKHMLIENEIKEKSRYDITNPNNFIVLSDDVSAGSQSVSDKAKKHKRKKQKKSKIRTHKKKVSIDLRDTSSDSISSPSSSDSIPNFQHKKTKRSSRSLTRKNIKRKRSLSSSESKRYSSNEKAVTKHRPRNIDHSTRSSHKKHKRSSSNRSRNSVRKYKIRNSRRVSMDYKTDRISECYFKKISKSYNNVYTRNSISSNGIVDLNCIERKYTHRQSNFNNTIDNVKNFWTKSRQQSKDDKYSRHNYNISTMDITQHDHFDNYKKIQDNHFRNYPPNNDSIQHSNSTKLISNDMMKDSHTAQINGNNTLSLEENVKLKAADNEIKKIEEFIFQLRSNMKP